MRIQQITKAVLFATEAHEGQTRKYTGEPYITHPMAVAHIVSGFGGTIEQVIAAYLHDTVEDVKRVTHQIIVANFGEDVAMLVHGMTKHEYPEGTKRKEKKAAEAIRLADCCERVQFIKCADIIHNSGTIIQHDVEFGALYLEENLHAVTGMTKADSTIREYALAILTAEVAKLGVLTAEVGKTELIGVE